MRALRIVASTWVPLLVVLVVAAAAIDAEGGWTTAGPILVGGLGALLGVFWLRQRPIPPSDTATYLRTALIKLALVEAVGLGGFVLAVVVGPWWISVVSALLSLIGLAASWPSESDRERHELLYLI